MIQTLKEIREKLLSKIEPPELNGKQFLLNVKNTYITNEITRRIKFLESQYSLIGNDVYYVRQRESYYFILKETYDKIAPSEREAIFWAESVHYENNIKLDEAFYSDFQKMYCSVQIKELTKDVFSRVEDGYSNLIDRAIYQKETEAKVYLARLFEETLRYLNK